jgi:hypothetical protein
MELKIELVISCALLLSVLTGAIHVTLFKKNDGLTVGLISMLSILFGLYLLIKNGITLDYGTKLQITKNHALIMARLGMANGITGLIFILFSIFKNIIVRKKIEQ